jgi:hypothetical protein
LVWLTFDFGGNWLQDACGERSIDFLEKLEVDETETIAFRTKSVPYIGS